MINELSHYKGQRMIVAMSGGVDSSVVAALLKQAGADIIGVFLNVWDYSRDDVCGHGSCCSTEDSYDARRVADMLNIPFYNMDMREAFRQDVIEPFIQDYTNGRTPNPCERCNRFIKFGALLKVADELEATYIATGHYVQRQDDADGIHILRGEDENKDQTYFLATLNQTQAHRVVFPVGHLCKDETRKLAESFQLPTAQKAESQDICFIPNGDRVGFLRQQKELAGLKEGNIVDGKGSILGHHKGIAYYTLGQRKGLGLSGGPWQVIGLDKDKAEVLIAPARKASVIRLKVNESHWLRQPKSDQVGIKTRYRSAISPCTITQKEDYIDVVFSQAQAPTAPGQVAAFYDGQELLGGGIIQQVYHQESS
ncbi:MAG: tRNA 2-thiouridine(34) synthase MnmA [Mariprofundaceae bacterium]|nr:tRNA 2-thiouridine(34) synthase MnmA [Mariprofundaceae bacterium]